MSTANEDLFELAYSSNISPEEMRSRFNKALEEGGHVNTTNEHYQPLIIASVSVGNDTMTTLLIKHGVNLDAMDKRQMTALMYATANGEVDSMNALVNAGADITMVDTDGNSFVDYAMRATKSGSSAFMLDAISHVIPNGGFDTFGNKDDSPIEKAIKLGDVSALKLMLDHGSDPNQTSGNHKTPILHNAVFTNNHKTANVLLDFGADPHKTDAFNKSSFNVAANASMLKDLSARSFMTDIDRIIFVKMEDIIKRFDLKDVGLSDPGFSGEDRLKHLNLFERKLAEAAKILGVEEKSLGLNKTLSFTSLNSSPSGEAGSIQGETGVIKIHNLNQPASVSTIIHEWTHAIDFKVHELVSDNESVMSFADMTAFDHEVMNMHKQDEIKQSLRNQAELAMNAIFSNFGDQGTTSFFKNEASALLKETSPQWLAVSSQDKIDTLTGQVESQLILLARNKVENPNFISTDISNLQSCISVSTGQQSNEFKAISLTAVNSMEASNQWENHMDRRMQPVNEMAKCVAASIELDKGKAGYWSSPIEMFARASQLRHDSYFLKMAEINKKELAFDGCIDSMKPKYSDNSNAVYRSLMDKQQCKVFDEAFGKLLEIAGVKRTPDALTRSLSFDKQVENASIIASKIKDKCFNVLGFSSERPRPDAGVVKMRLNMATFEDFKPRAVAKLG